MFSPRHLKNLTTKTFCLVFAVSLSLFSSLSSNPNYTSETVSLFPEKASYSPWFTGPLLAPTAVNMQPGHPAIEPTITLFATYGAYQSNWKVEHQSNIWAINSLVDFQFAFSSNTGLEVLASCISNFNRGRSATNLQDTLVFLGYQLSQDRKESWIPDCRIMLQETFPTGKYQNLDPNKKRIDSTGFGSFQTGPVIACHKLFYPQDHAFGLYWSLAYLFPAKVHVEGFNTYGGGYHTKGIIYPGQSLLSFLSGEYSITQNWVFAFDTEFSYQRKSKFAGYSGETPNGQTAKTGLPLSIQISIAPEVEYNFSINNGLLAGVWLTVAGKNANAFVSTFMAWVYIF